MARFFAEKELKDSKVRITIEQMVDSTYVILVIKRGWLREHIYAKMTFADRDKAIDIFENITAFTA